MSKTTKLMTEVLVQYTEMKKARGVTKPGSLRVRNPLHYSQPRSGTNEIGAEKTIL